ncbi:hypothetical protein BBW65_03065 [Helicobacter enhydrae]|uniref:Fido domain-containing protein n=1 Tax=Helicobacter enhydrae TaxID=222136 RepID=A0A1B1U4W8_9HELI|nr:Fic family protein [Helicobacter enhydrae]ANV97844.1 hypothetical protein BBW65_03065 [Helicobacter enhydrae]
MSKIKIPTPSFDSSLASLIVELEKLRHKTLGGNVPPYIFFSIKEIFQLLETLGSARIEGNNTTLSDYIEDTFSMQNLSHQEIENLKNAMQFIEEHTDEDTRFNQAYFFELHKIVMFALKKDWVSGKLRDTDVSIQKSNHTPPSAFLVAERFQEFIDFINTEYKQQFQTMMIAIAHHRFEHIHPFADGNGRMGRLLTYALLIKLGFRVKDGRIINPSSVFYADRNRYYDMLSKADSLQEQDLLEWCEYFLGGLKNEMQKIDFLLQKDNVREEVLIPIIRDIYKLQIINKDEKNVLELLVEQEDMLMKADRLGKIGITDTKQKTKILTMLKAKNILTPQHQASRIYGLNLIENPLLRLVITQLKALGFVDDFLEKTT